MTSATAPTVSHDPEARLPRLFAVAFAAGLFLLCHPYLGLVGDATIYIGRAVADLDPNGVGRDIAFVGDGQSRFSLFARVATPIVAALGPAKASLAIALAADAAVFAALLSLATALASGRLAFAILVVAAVMPRQYGDGGAFLVAESAAHARPFAEAAVMAALASLLRGRGLLAALCLGIALLLHPIMAVAGMGTALVLLVWRRSWQGRMAAAAVLVAAACCVLLLAWSGVPLIGRLFTTVDPVWLALLKERSPFLFPTLWSAHAVAQVVAQVSILALAAYLAPANRRRVFTAVLVSALAQLAALALLGDGLHSLLAIQEQGWRALWLVTVLSACALPLLAVDLWARGPGGQVALAVVGLVWLVPLPPLATAGLCILSFLLCSDRYGGGLRRPHAAAALAAAAVLCLLLQPWLGYAAFLRSAPRPIWLSTLPVLLNNLQAAPVLLVLAVWLLRGNPAPVARWRIAVLAIAAAITLGGAAVAWDRRTPGAAALESRREPPGFDRLMEGRPDEVLWLGGLGESWFALGRPQYMSAQQPVGSVFSRALAMEWRRRALVLSDLGLVPRSILTPHGASFAEAPPTVTVAKIEAFCKRADAPGAVLVPEHGSSNLTSDGAINWPLPTPIWMPDDADASTWHAVTGWTILPCAPRRVGGASPAPYKGLGGE